MTCTRCGRWMYQPAATVTTDAGKGVYGPVCAQKLGLLTAAVKNPFTTRARRVRRNDKQLELAV